MADWSLPTLTSLYTDVLDSLKERDEDAAKMFDNSGANLPSGTIRWNSSNARFEKFDGSSWGVLSGNYNITVNPDLNTAWLLKSGGTMTGELSLSTNTVYQLTARSEINPYAVMLGGGNNLGAILLLDGMDGDFAGADYAMIIAEAGGGGALEITTRGRPLTNDGAKVWNEASLKGGLGMTGETWVDETENRDKDTVYTNDNSYPIIVSVQVLLHGERTFVALKVDDVELVKFATPYSNSDIYEQYFTLTAIVPPGFTYELTSNYSIDIYKWHELK